MSEIETTSMALLDKPVESGDIEFPPFPEPTDADFDEASEEEKNFYKTEYKDLNVINQKKLHCTACDRHLGSSSRHENRMRTHPMLRTLVCNTCHTFYNSGEFEKGDDGSELYCRWCGQGGQVYCCADCQHVFCAKCIKRNLGMSKIKEIENADDWKCFKCNPDCLREHRALCWALLRFCDLKNKIIHTTSDPVLKAKYKKLSDFDASLCCKNKIARRKQLQDLKKKDKERESESIAKKKDTDSVISKIPPTIQVKKFASINLDDTPKQERKGQKRSLSPKTKYLNNPISIAAKISNAITYPNPTKKIKIPNMPTPSMRFSLNDTSPNLNTYRPRPIMKPIRMNTSQNTILNSHLNGYGNTGLYNNMFVNDNINLSLESLTQGLDMRAVASMNQDDLICTPDFPLEPVCEVTEEADDDVQCITPSPASQQTYPKSITTPPPLLPRLGNSTPDLIPENIIQMTENDVSVNAVTGGLKFRVDPQTLSSNKMYRLPDGRIFSINSNPNMPGGYSATIVAVAGANSGNASAPKSGLNATFAAKLSSVSPVYTPTPNIIRVNRAATSKAKPKVTRATEKTARNCDLNVPIEWFRYNLVDAVDTLEYSLSRLQKLKSQASTMYLRSRTVDEMRSLHRSLDQLLNTSASRFKEIRDNLNKEVKQYVLRKSRKNNDVSDDDDVEILNDTEDPIFIDENSIEASNKETEDVDLTCTEKSIDHSGFDEDSFKGVGLQSYIGEKVSKDSHKTNGNKCEENKNAEINEGENLHSVNRNTNVENTIGDVEEINIEGEKCNKSSSDDSVANESNSNEKESASEETLINESTEDEKDPECKEIVPSKCSAIDDNDKSTDTETAEKQMSAPISDARNDKLDVTNANEDIEMNETKSDLDAEINEDKDLAQEQDTEMSDEMIETLLKDDTAGEDIENFDVSELQDS